MEHHSHRAGRRAAGFLSSRFMGLAQRFIAANRRASRSIEAWLPAQFRRHLHTVYKYQVADLVNRRPGQVVLDIGGGKECPFLPFLEDPSAHLIVAVDCSEYELRCNPDLKNKIVADVAAKAFPLRDRSADLVVSRSVVEHLYDTEAFYKNCARVLREGGALVHTFPCRFAPFSIINRFLPNVLARRLLAFFHPYWEDECGFRAFYDRCHFSAVKSTLDRNGFEDAQYMFRYYQSIYFDFFVPFYLVNLVYDLLIWLLGIRTLACAMLVTARRPSCLHPENGTAG